MFNSLFNTLKSATSSTLDFLGNLGSGLSANALSGTVSPSTQASMDALSAPTVQETINKATSGSFLQSTPGDITNQSRTRNALPNQVQNIVNLSTGGKAGPQSLPLQSVIDQITGGNKGGQSRLDDGYTGVRKADGTPGGIVTRRREREGPRDVTVIENGGPVYYDLQGNRIALSGFTGSSGFQSFLPAQGLPGQTGESGRSNFTGIQTAAGGLGGTATPEEDEQLQGQTIKPSKQLQDIIGAAGVTPGLQSVPTANVERAFNNLAAPTQEIAPAVGGVVSASQVGSGLQTQVSTRQSMLDQLETIKTQALKVRDQLDMMQPTPQMPIEDTLAQLEFIQQSQDPYGIAQAMDAYRAANTDLVELQRAKVETMKDIQAINKVYRGVVDDIKGNPDLPKGLAQRRLQEVYSQNKELLQGFLDQLELVNQSIDDQNELVNRQFNVLTRAENLQAQAQQRAMQLLEFYTQSGAIAGMSDTELARLAQQTGVTPGSLSTLKRKVLSSEKALDLEFRSAGDEVIVFDKATGQVVSRVLGQKRNAGGTGITVAQPVSKAEFKQMLEEERLQSVLPTELDALYQEYSKTATGISGFTPTETEKKKLAAAGLLSADPQSQLEHLYSKNDLSTIISSAIAGAMSGASFNLNE